MLAKPFVVTLNKAPNETGVAISEQVLAVPDAVSNSGMRYQTLIGVLWENKRTPAVSYHDPSELSWVALLDVANEGDYEDEYEDDETAETTENVTAN